MSRLCIVVNDNKLYYFGLFLGDGVYIFIFGNLVVVFVVLKRREEEIIYCLYFLGIFYV